MTFYMMRNASTAPQLQGQVNDTPTYLYELLNREEDFCDNSSTNPFFNREAREEAVFRNTYENQPRSGYGNEFYHDEYSWLISQMNKYMPGKETEDTLQKLLNISQLADEALCAAEGTYNTALGSSFEETPLMINIMDLIHGKQRRDRNHLLFMLEEQAMVDRDKKLLLMHRMTQEFNHSERPIPEKKSKHKICEYKVEPESKDRVAKHQEEKKADCWHFIRGHCKRGKYCDFSHDSRQCYPDSCKVFLGGLPFHITEAALRQKLSEKGFNVVNKPKVFGGFSPQVCLASADEAKRLIKERTIMIEGMDVDIRPYQAFTKKNKDKLLDISRRSVFLGGLAKGTTTQMIKKELECLGLKIVNYPLVKAGFSPQVTMATAKQAQTLVNMVKVQINGTMVDIRPSRPYTAFGSVS